MFKTLADVAALAKVTRALQQAPKEEGKERLRGGREGRRIRIWMACVHTPRQGQDMAESTQLSEMCRKKIKEKNNAKSCDKFTFLRSPSSSFRLSSLCFLLIFSCFSPSCCPCTVYRMCCPPPTGDGQERDRRGSTLKRMERQMCG